MWADHLYVLRDCGILIAVGSTVFASPFWDVRLIFTEDGGASPQLRLVEPSFGHRKRKRVFHGWMLGVRGRAFSMSSIPPEDQVALKDWSRAAAETIRGRNLSSADILMILDQLLDRLSEQPEPPCSGQVDRFLSLSSLEPGVTRLASLLGQSPRTLQRRLRVSTGLSPKRFLAVERFSRAVRALPTGDVKLSHIAEDLHFSDQAHMTREFRRHAGLSPKAFQLMWSKSPSHQAVRFFQDTPRTPRLRVAVWAAER
jgi:AraC-like DNA-binding protein